MGNFFTALGHGLGQFVVIIFGASFHGITNTAAAILRTRFGQGLIAFVAGWQFWANGYQDAGLLLGLVGLGLMFWSTFRR